MRSIAPTSPWASYGAAACNGFSPGMRAQRFAGYASVSGLSPLVIPPDLSVAPAPEDIPDAAFERE